MTTSRLHWRIDLMPVSHGTLGLCSQFSQEPRRDYTQTPFVGGHV